MKPIPCAPKILLLLSTIIPLSAAERTWTGGDDSASDWSLNDNWLNGAPALDDSIRFDSNSVDRLSTVNDLIDWRIFGITVDDPAGDVSISGETFTQGAGGITLGSSRNLSLIPGPITAEGMSNATALGANQTWQIAEGRTLTMGAIANAPADDITVTVQGGGLLRFFNQGNLFQHSPNWNGTIRLDNSSLYAQIGIILNTDLTTANAERALGDGSTVILNNADFHFAMNFDTSVNLKTTWWWKMIRPFAWNSFPEPTLGGPVSMCSR